MIKPEDVKHCEFIIESVFKHELSTMKVYHEEDLIRTYFQIKEKFEGIFDRIDTSTIASKSLF